MSVIAGGSILDSRSTLSREVVIPACEEGRWDEIGGRFAIFPFQPKQALWMSYDLTVGPEAYSIRWKRRVTVDTGNPLQIEPGETVLVLIDEYLVFGPSVAGLIIGKTSWMNSGVVQPTTRIDPTWFGRFPVPLTNHSTRVMRLSRGQPFCTCIINDVKPDLSRDRWMTRDRVPHLGSSSLNYEGLSMEQWEPCSPTAATRERLEGIPSRFGPPFDLVIAGLLQAKDTIIHDLQTKWGPEAIREMRQAVVEEQVRLSEAHSEELRRFHLAQVELLQKQLVETQGWSRRLTFMMVIVVLGWLAALVLIIVRLEYIREGVPAATPERPSLGPPPPVPPPK